ncbi:MAG: hypothetical protein R3E66_19580 [bacterium]
MKSLKWMIVAAALAFGAGCGEDLLNNGPEIVSMSISPDSVPATSTGMTDQFVTVTLTVAGFNDPINVDGTRVFIEANNVDGVYQSSALVGDTITLSTIATSWFQGLTEGEYSLGAEVVTVDGDNGEPTEKVSQIGLATITITP